jgi:hypothetical protein
MQLETNISQRRQLGRQRLFLSRFAESGNILTSARWAGISRQLVYYWRETSPAFASKLSAAADVAFQSPQSASLVVKRKERSAR